MPVCLPLCCFPALARQRFEPPRPRAVATTAPSASRPREREPAARPPGRTDPRRPPFQMHRMFLFFSFLFCDDFPRIPSPIASTWDGIGIGMENRQIEGGWGFPWFAWRNRVKKKEEKRTGENCRRRCCRTVRHHCSRGGRRRRREFTLRRRAFRSDGDRRTLPAWF